MLVSVAAIVDALGEASRRFDIDLLTRCESTNATLLARAEAGAASGTVVIAEEQTAGRGRRGRSWFASRGDSLTFSLLWRLPPSVAPAGLSLAVGVAVARALERAGISPVALKWPNDILMDGRKLGGILVELVPGAPHAAVIGIGINLRLPAAMPDELRLTSAAIGSGETTTDPNRLLAALLGELLAILETFATAGFAPIRPEWMARHAHQDQPVVVASDFAPPTGGICRGVDGDGALLLEADGRVTRILSGEVSLRPVGATS